MDACSHFYIWLAVVCFFTTGLYGRSGLVNARETTSDGDGKRSLVRFTERANVQINQSINLTIQKNNSQIPVSLFLGKDVKTIDDFLLNFVKDKDRTSAEFLIHNSNTSSMLRSSSSDLFNDLAPLAACLPEPTTIELEESVDPSYIYFPPCTKIERCGGCCTHPRLSCQPTETERIDVKMLVMKFDPESESFAPDGVKVQTLEKHTSCECRCSIKEEHCTEMQHYIPNECRCKCNNEVEMDTCVQPNKYWDSVLCVCTCRLVQDCSTGFYFDKGLCTCKKNQLPNIVFNTADEFSKFRGHSYDVLNKEETSTLSPKAAFRGR